MLRFAGNFPAIAMLAPAVMLIAPGAARPAGADVAAAARVPAIGQVLRDCPHRPEMAAVPAGTLSRGSPFAAGVHGATFGEGDGRGCGGYRPDDEGWGRGWRPAIDVSRDDAQSCAARPSRETGAPYRLPGESGWEHLARAGTATRYRRGDDCDELHCNGSGCGNLRDRESNAFGLHGVHGNVEERIQDCGEDDWGVYSGTPVDGGAWAWNGDSCRERVLRGGSWRDGPADLRAVAASPLFPGRSGYRGGGFGFRVARPSVAAARSEASERQGDPWRDRRELLTGRRMVCLAPLEPAPIVYKLTVRGDFLGDGQKIALALWDGRGGCYIGREDGEGLSAPLHRYGDVMEFAGVCRDRVSGRDLAIVHTWMTGSANASHRTSIWRLEATGPHRVHFEYFTAYPVAADGACRWRERQRGIEIIGAAMAALRIDKRPWTEDEPESGRDGLPWRALAAQTVREHLLSLRGGGIASFEGAFYADENARDSWFVMQILPAIMGAGGEGVVLLLERGTGQWKTIYNLQPGGRPSSPVLRGMRGMVVAGDRLYAALCVSDCEYDGVYTDFEIDLRTNRATDLDEGAEAPGPSEEENPGLDDPVAAAFPE